ncbi:hypothetical protein niasHT_002877 [Heterodera trifolii]|uniref:Uncharacterized protein n=1 Tax=Heterodera trifolii TaxID=157864 RepID=A0ABD2M5R5_9BILA
MGERQRKGRRDGRRRGKFVLSLAAISIKRMEPKLMANFSALKQLDFSQNFLGFLLFGIFDGLDELQALLGLASLQWVNVSKNASEELEWFSAEAEQIEIEANGN